MKPVEKQTIPSFRRLRSDDVLEMNRASILGFNYNAIGIWTNFNESILCKYLLTNMFHKVQIINPIRKWRKIKKTQSQQKRCNNQHLFNVLIVKNQLLNEDQKFQNEHLKKKLVLPKSRCRNSQQTLQIFIEAYKTEPLLHIHCNQNIFSHPLTCVQLKYICTCVY